MIKSAVICILFFAVFSSVYAQSGNELRRLADEIRNEEKELKKLRGEKVAVARQLELIASKTANYKKMLIVLDVDIKSTAKRLENVRAETKKANLAISKLKGDALRGNIFIIDNLGYADIKVIASAERQEGVIAALEILSLATSAVADKTDELNVQLERLKYLTDEEKAELDGLKALRSERTAAVKNLDVENRRYRDTLTLLKHDEAGRREYIEMLEFQRSELNSTIKGSERSQTTLTTTNKAFESKKGKLPSAISGRVIEGYGEHLVKEAGITVFHKGIKVRPFKSSDVSCVADGTVVFADFMKGFENLVVVSHGLPYYTVYGNMNYLNVSAGDKVTADAVLGSIDVGAEYGGAYLYFEIRKNEQALDPNVWLAKDTKGVNR